MQQILGEIRLLAWDDVPAGWLKCEGQSLDINRYPKLYMMIGVKFGQEGKFQFTLPDLREKAPSGMVYCIAAEGGLPGFLGEEKE
jgi:microcystin-dependent protein